MQQPGPSWWKRCAACSALLLGGAMGCGSPAQTFGTATPQGRAIAELFVVALALSTVILALVYGLLAYVLRRYRGRPGDPEPPQVEGHRNLELIWTTTPLLLLTIVYVLTVRTMRAVDSAADAPGTLRVQAIGHQWWWEFRYPDLGVVTANELHAPVGVPLRVELEAFDVIHSFWVPALGWKRDAIPGKTNVMSLRVDEAGVYDGACAEFCGIQHAWMRIHLVAESPDQFGAWVRGQLATPPAGPPNGVPSAGQDSLVARGQQVFLQRTCINCHTVQGTPADGRVGPDLTHVAGRAWLGGGVVENTPENMARWVRDARTLKPGVLMPPFALSDDDLSAVVTYLEGLR
jgi:cytochrome c oxidase subunit II